MQTVELGKQMPNLVSFEMRAEKDPETSLKEGRPCFRDVPYVIVTKPGNRDVYEKRATEWLDQKHREAANGSYPPEWIKAYKHAFEEWQKGNEIPIHGTPIRLWPGASPSEVQACLQANVRTVEELANIEESGLGMIGLGARALRDKARNYITSATDKGQVIEMLASIKGQLESVQAELKDEKRKREELEAALAAERSRQPTLGVKSR